MSSSSKKTRVALTTLGCKVNQFESASFLSGFRESGVEIVPFSRQADVYVVNTCAVTSKAAAQSRQTIRRALRANPEARVVVTGCYAQVASREILELAERPLCIVGNGNKHLLVDVALMRDDDCGGCDLEMYMGDIGRKKEVCPLTVTAFPDRTRAFLRVQDGCNNFCSYCIVPYARGRSRSVPQTEVLAQAERFAAEGFRETVVTGIHVGHYGRDLEPATDLLRLMAALVRRLPEMRFRISSLEPTELSDELLELIASAPNLMPHLHIPLQSGDDSILRKMNRRYEAADFAGVVARAARRLPGAAIGVDVLVGFPGEGEEAFRNTARLLEDLPVTYLHVFPYSSRPGTVAAGLPGHLPKTVKEERVAELRELDHKKRTAFHRLHLGQTRPVLVERKKEGLLRGFTDNYIPVSFAGSSRLAGQVVSVRLESLGEGLVCGAAAGPGGDSV